VTNTADDLKDVGPWGQAVALAFKFLFFGTFVIVFGWLVSNVRQVPSDSQAVVIRFGSVARIEGAGLLIALPKPLERVVMLPASARQLSLSLKQFDAGLDGDATSGYELSRDPRQNSGFLLTGDSNVVHLDAQVFYQVDEPVAYMVAQVHVRPALAQLFEATAVEVLGSRDLDSILVARPELASGPAQAARRERLRSDLLAGLNKRLADLTATGAGLGIRASRIDLLPAIPGGAKSAFDNVLVVSQSAETAIANARTAAQQTSSDANSKKDKIATSATATAQEIVTNAKTATASILALGENAKTMSTSMQMTQIYYSRMEPILKKAGSVDVQDPEGVVHIILPVTEPSQNAKVAP